MFFVLSKIFWALAQPLNALCLLALAGFLIGIRWKVIGHRMMAAALAAIVILGALPIGPMMLSWLEYRYPTPEALPAKIDGIIVLGGAFDSHMTAQTGHLSANDQVDRMFCFAELAKTHPHAKLVFSGGAGDIMNPDAMEIEDAAIFFNLTGLGKRNIIYEDKSRNTYENALFTKKLVNPKHGENWIVTTSAYHIPRTVAIFEKMDWQVIPYGCDQKTLGVKDIVTRIPNATGNFHMLNLAVKELLGMVAYKITGKI